MTAEVIPKRYSSLILLVSLIGLLSILVTNFAGEYIPGDAPGTGRYYTCVSCPTSQEIIIFIIIIVALLLGAQIIIAVKDWMQNKSLSKGRAKTGLTLAGLTLLCSLIGGAIFLIPCLRYKYQYDEGRECWFEIGFYVSIITGTINILLFS